MRTFVTFLFCGFVVCGLAVSTVRAGEKVDNPEYKHWAQFKPGSFSEMKTEFSRFGHKWERTTTTTLKEITSENAVLEIKVVMTGSGQKWAEPPAEKRKIPAKVEEAKARESDPPKKGDQRDGGEVLDVKQGEEELTICGKKLKTKWVETKIKRKDLTTTARTWSCNDVPGQVVKTTTNSEGTSPLSSMGEVVKFKADKTEQKKAATR
jgi:hypothetical protein